MYIGIDIGGTNLVAGVTDDKGRIINKVSRPVDKGLDAQGLCSELIRLSLDAAELCNVLPRDVKAVGAGFPGLVDNKSGVVVQTPNMPFQNTPFRQSFQEKWNVPVFLGNDANCAAIGEYWAGAAMGCDPVVMITLGTGIGGGMVVNGKLFTGFANSGMEAGHIIIHPNGLPCNCGNHGCWEQYGSATALIRITREHMVRSPDSAMWQAVGGELAKVTGRTSFQAARAGDAAAKRVLHEYLEGLSIGLISIVNLLQPEVICLGGGVSNAEDDLLLDPLRELMAKGSYDKSCPTRLVKAALGNDAGIVGAAMLCNMF